jgi:hypothetical protein
MPSTASRSPLLIRWAFFVLAALSAAIAPSAPAQELDTEEPAPPMSAAELREQRVAIGRLLDSEQWGAAEALLQPLLQSLNEHEATYELDGLRCVEQVVRLRTGSEHGEPSGYFILPRQLARKGKEAERYACVRQLGLAYAAALARPNLSDSERARSAENAAFWLRDALTLRPSPALQRTYRELPSDAHKLVASLPGLRKQSLRNAVGEHPSLEALARAVDRVAWLRDPTRNMHCDYEFTSYLEPYGDSTALPFIECDHSLEHFLVEPTPSGALRIVASMQARDYGWCGTGMSFQYVSHSKLTPHEHGFDGYLVVWAFSQEDSWRGMDELVGNTTVTICSRQRGVCRHVPAGTKLCVSRFRGDEGKVGEDPPCVEWQGVPEVKKGRLTLRPALRDGKPGPLIPRAFARPLDLHAPFGSLTPRDATAPAQLENACWLRVTSPHSPLNVRASPSDAARVITTLADGAITRALERRAGFYRIEHPQVGWVWAKSVTNVCDGHQGSL